MGSGEVKSFGSDLELLHEMLCSGKNFSFSKYADGEYAVLRGIPITNCDGWRFDPDDHKENRRLLVESFRYSGEGYIAGISCPCCQPKDHVQWMRDNCKSDYVTWANLLVNSNYESFKSLFFPEFKKRKVTLVANESGADKEMPFECDYIPVSGHFWLQDVSGFVKDMRSKAKNSRDEVYLFSCGPLGNILAHQMHQENKENVYMDIGSTINPWVLGNNRGYLRGRNKKTCIW